MKQKIFDEGNLQVLSDGDDFYVRYDAGAHQPAIREDKISKDEADQIMSGKKEATKVLFALQKRLIDANIDAHKSNISD